MILFNRAFQTLDLRQGILESGFALRQQSLQLRTGLVTRRVHIFEPLNFILKSLDRLVALSNLLVLALNRELALSQLLSKFLYLGLKVLNLALEHLNLLAVLGLQMVHLVLGGHLLLAPSFLHSSLKLLLHLLSDFFFVLFGLCSKRVFTIELLLQELIVFSVVLLDVSGNLFGVLLFERFYGFVVVFEFEQLLFIVVAPCIKSLFNFQKVMLHILGLVSVLFIEMCLFFGHGLLVHLEFPL